MTSEAEVQNMVRLWVSRHGGRIWRNNVGVLLDSRGVPVRYGLANETKDINKVYKSSDLVGIMPHVVTDSDVGQTLGIFTAIEVKRTGWAYRGSGAEAAQARWINEILDLGGRGGFVTEEKDLWRLIYA